MKLTRQALLASLCLLAAVGAYLLTPRQLLADLEPVNLEQMVPLQFANWRALPEHDDVITSPEQEAFIKSIYSQVLSRVYVDDAGHRIMLSIAYTRDQSDNSGTQSHKPEICYPAQGFQIVSNQQQDLRVREGQWQIRHLVAARADRTEPITYWNMIGIQPAVTGTAIKKAQLYLGMQGVIADGLIVRISNISEDVADSFVIHSEFIEQLLHGMDAYGKKRIAGI